MGCRFMTSYHGVVDRAQVRPGEWVAVHGCGGIGLSAIHVAAAIGANVIAVDLDDRKLEYGRLMTTEMGKPIKAAIEEAAKCAVGCRYYADNAERFLGDEPVNAQELAVPSQNLFLQTVVVQRAKPNCPQ